MSITTQVTLTTMSVEIVKYRGREYVSLDDLRRWVIQSALENTDPIVKHVMMMIANELSKK